MAFDHSSKWFLLRPELETRSLSSHHKCVYDCGSSMPFSPSTSMRNSQLLLCYEIAVCSPSRTLLILQPKIDVILSLPGSKSKGNSIRWTSANAFFFADDVVVVVLFGLCHSWKWEKRLFCWFCAVSVSACVGVCALVISNSQNGDNKLHFDSHWAAVSAFRPLIFNMPIRCASARLFRCRSRQANQSLHTFQPNRLNVNKWHLAIESHSQSKRMSSIADQSNAIRFSHSQETRQRRRRSEKPVRVLFPSTTNRWASCEREYFFLLRSHRHNTIVCCDSSIALFEHRFYFFFLPPPLISVNVVFVSVFCLNGLHFWMSNAI